MFLEQQISTLEWLKDHVTLKKTGVMAAENDALQSQEYINIYLNRKYLFWIVLI